MMIKHFLVNSILVLAFSLSPTGNAIRMPILADPSATQVFLPLIGNSMPLVVVHKSNTCLKPGSSFAIRGDITSLIDQAFHDVIVEGRAYDQDGQLLYTAERRPVLTATLTGQLNPFEIGFGIHCAYVSYSKVEIKSWSTESPQLYWPATLVYTSTVESFGDGTRVTAEFRNDAGVPMHNITGYFWSPSQLYSYGPMWLIADSLAPGETVTYTEFLDDVYGSAKSTIEVAAQGVIEP